MAKHTSKEAYYDRLKNLADINKSSSNESKSRNLGNLIDYKRAADGVAYGIIKENHLYYIKKAGIKQDPNVSDFAYIGGMENITGYQFKSLSEADKQRNMMFHTIGEAVQLKPSKTGSKLFLTEDVAGKEIDQATSKLGDLDAATDMEKTATPPEGETEMAAGLESMPTDAGAPVPTPDETPMPDATTPPDDGSVPEMGDEEVPTDSEETPADAAVSPEGETDEPNTDILKAIGKLTNAIRKTEMTDPQVKSNINSFLSAFKDKLRDIDIEDRKEMANKILKVVGSEEIDDLENSMPEDKPEDGIEEEQCVECGGFGKYAESRGYGSPESFMECDGEEQANVVSGYANAHNDGMNDGDLETVGLVIKLSPEILNKLKGDYGHDEYAEKLTPYAEGMNEASDEDNMAKLNELWGGLGNAFKKVGGDIGNVAKAGAQAVGGAVHKGAQAVGNVAKAGAEKVGQYATGVQQSYHAGEVPGEVKKLQDVATNLGKQIQSLNTRLTKAGQQPIDVKNILKAVSQQVTGKGVGLNQFMTAEGTDPAYTQVQPNMLKEEDEVEEPELDVDDIDVDNEKEGDVEDVKDVESTPIKNGFGFAPDSQNLGVGVIKPETAATTAVDVNVDAQNKTVNVTMSEAKRILIKSIAESVNKYMAESKPSAGLSTEKKSAVVKKAKKGEDIGKAGKGFEKVAKKAEKEYGSKEKGEKVAAAAMWKNVKREGVEEKSEVMTESEMKLRNYIRNRLDEMKGNKKPSLNESKKSPVLKKLDEVIQNQLEIYRSKANKK